MKVRNGGGITTGSALKKSVPAPGEGERCGDYRIVSVADHVLVDPDASDIFLVADRHSDGGPGRLSKSLKILLNLTDIAKNSSLKLGSAAVFCRIFVSGLDTAMTELSFSHGPMEA